MRARKGIELGELAFARRRVSTEHRPSGKRARDAFGDGDVGQEHVFLNQSIAVTDDVGRRRCGREVVIELEGYFWLIETHGASVEASLAQAAGGGVEQANGANDVFGGVLARDFNVIERGDGARGVIASVDDVLNVSVCELGGALDHTACE